MTSPLRPAPESSPSGILRRSGWWVALTVVIAVYLVSACWHVQYGAFNTDEGFYAIATRAVAAGEMPYRDFGFSQPPVVLYANALPLRLIGFGLFDQRAINGAWAALALLMACVWLSRHTNAWWGLGLALLFALSAPWMHFTHLGKTYAVTTILGVLATWAYLAAWPIARRNFVLGVLAVVGVASRLPAMPFFGLLWCFALWPGRKPSVRELQALWGGTLLALAVVVMPFWIAAPEACQFWVIDLHRVAGPHKEWSLSWREIGAWAPGVWLLLLAVIATAMRHRQWRSRKSAVLLAVGVTLAFNLLPNGVYGEYATPFLLPAAMVGLALLHSHLAAADRWWRWGLGLALAATQLAAAPLLQAALRPERIGTLSQWLPAHAPPYQKTLPTDLAKVRAMVSAILPPAAPFVGSNIILAAETGHFVPPELRMGPFSWTNEMSPARAARLHLATRAQLDAWFTREDVTLLVFFQRWDLNYSWSMPSFDRESVAVRTAQMQALMHTYYLAFFTDDFYVLERRGLPRPTRPAHDRR